MVDFKMPSLGADMVEGTLSAWVVKVGDHVKRGDLICEVETNKGSIDVEVWNDGVITELLVEPGTKVPVGQTIATLAEGDSVEPSPAPIEAPTPAVMPAPEPPSVQVPSVAPAPTAAPKPATTAAAPAPRVDGDRPIASPAARRRATELGVTLGGIRGTGVDGAITLDDVNAHKNAPEAHRRVSPVARKIATQHGLDVEKIEGHGAHGAVVQADVEAALQPPKSDPNAKMREAIAAAMAKSKREIPHYYLQESIPMENALKWLETFNAERSATQRILPAVLLIKAVSLAAQDFPQMNGFFVDGAHRPSPAIHAGFVISLRTGGLVAPAIHDAETKDLPTLMSDLRDLVARSRSGKLRASEVTDSTLTITSLGDLGVETVFGIIYPPQVAIVGFGQVSDRVVADHGIVGIRPMISVTWSGDHRVSDGITGAKFLNRIKELLQTPENL